MKTRLLFILLLLTNIIFAQSYVAFAEEMPVFSGCENIIDSRQKCECTKAQFANYIETKLSPLSSGNTEMVINIGIIIYGRGLPTNLQVFDSDSLDDETKDKIIQSINFYDDGIRFEPGRNGGRVVNVQMVIPVRVFTSL